jgi:benzoyl-CoA reductase/2-hydroxyglutaryl-CoA dehydratase subunit BcrC/BadD/HgdB
VPHVKESEISRQFWLEQMHALMEKLERYTRSGLKKRKITPGRLEKAMEDMSRAQFQMRRLMELRARPAPLIWGRQAMLVANAYGLLPVDVWTEATMRLNDELSERARKNVSVCSPRIPRILLAGSPMIFPNWMLPALVEEMGAVVVCDESCTGDRALYDPVGSPERTLRSQMAGLASRYLMPCVCPSFTPNEDRIVKLVRMIQAHGVDGVLYHVLKGCVVYDFEVGRVEEALKKLNIPFLRIETDYSPEDVEQLRTRIEAFMEMLKTRKKNSQRKENG